MASEFFGSRLSACRNSFSASSKRSCSRRANPSDNRSLIFFNLATFPRPARAFLLFGSRANASSSHNSALSRSPAFKYSLALRNRLCDSPIFPGFNISVAPRHIVVTRYNIQPSLFHISIAFTVRFPGHCAQCPGINRAVCLS